MSQLDLFAAPKPITRREAVDILTPYLGKNLRPIAENYGFVSPYIVPKNKGWAGHTVEALLGKKPDNDQAPDFGDWELKVIPTQYNEKQRSLTLKSDLAITMFQAKNVYESSFEESHLFAKTQHMLIALRIYHEISESYSPLYALAIYDLQSTLKDKIKEEYDNIRWLLREQGIMGLKSFQGQYLAIHTKGKSTHHWSFYAQRRWVSEMLQQELIIADAIQAP